MMYSDKSAHCADTVSDIQAQTSCKASFMNYFLKENRCSAGLWWLFLVTDTEKSNYFKNVRNKTVPRKKKCVKNWLFSIKCLKNSS